VINLPQKKPDNQLFLIQRLTPGNISENSSVKPEKIQTMNSKHLQYYTILLPMCA